MIDAANPDYLEGGLINFEKKRKEFEVLAQVFRNQIDVQWNIYNSNPKTIRIMESLS